MDLVAHSGFTYWGDYKSNWITTNQRKCFFVRGKNQSIWGKTYKNRVENPVIQLTYDSGSGNRTHATLVGGECSHHCAKNVLWEFAWVFNAGPKEFYVIMYFTNWVNGLSSPRLDWAELISRRIDDQLAELNVDGCICDIGASRSQNKEQNGYVRILSPLNKLHFE